jgi:hypothetical protein
MIPGSKQCQCPISRVTGHVPRTKDFTCPVSVNQELGITEWHSGKLVLCLRSGAEERAARGSVSAFRGRRATGGSSLEAGRPRLQRRLLGRHRDGVRLSAAAKRYPLGSRAENGGRTQQPGSILAERSFPALARRARQIPSAHALRRMRRNGSNADLHVSLFGSNRGTCHFALLS